MNGVYMDWLLGELLILRNTVFVRPLWNTAMFDAVFSRSDKMVVTVGVQGEFLVPIVHYERNT